MTKRISIKFEWGQTVVLRTNPTTPRVITGIMLRSLRNITYGLASGENETWHQETEIMSCGQPFRVKGFKG